MTFQAQVAVVTGAASGMGNLCVKRMTQRAIKVACIDVNEEVLTEMCKSNLYAEAYPCDISDAKAVETTIKKIEKDLGPIDCLIHAAALMPAAPFATMDIATIEKLIQVNYFGSVYITRAVLPAMLERKSGQIVLFGSVAGHVLTPELGAYSVSKAAVNIFGEQLIYENKGSGVHILLVCPPAVNTPLVDQALASPGMKNLRVAQEQQRLTKPEHIIDDIEAALAKGKTIIFPRSAFWLHWMRRLVPSLLWNIILRSNK